MENKELKFKTSLNCGGCVSKVQADLDNEVRIAAWSVDTDNENKILTVSSNGITEEQVVAILEERGFSAEPLV